MKNTIITILLAFICTGPLKAQNVNWQWMDDQQPHYAHLNLGYDFGVTAQAGYNYLLKFKVPILLTADYSFPMGDQLFDDYKFRLGGQVKIAEYQNFVASLKVFGHFKRHETAMVRLFNLGTEASALIGYYQPKWHVAGEFGLDKPFTSHIKHSDIVRENFPNVQDGWFSGSGGHFFYGLQAGKSLSNTLDLSMRIGGTKAISGHKDAIIARYVQIGLMKRF